MALQNKVKFFTIFLGVLQITVGCAVGFIPPTAVEWYRGIVMSNIEFTINGILMIAFGFLVPMLSLGARTLKVWFAALQIGTWTNGTAGLVAGIAGASSNLLVTLNEKFPAPNGNDHRIVTGLLMTCGISVMIALFITLFGLWKMYLGESKIPAGDGPLTRRSKWGNMSHKI